MRRILPTVAIYVNPQLRKKVYISQMHVASAKRLVILDTQLAGEFPCTMSVEHSQYAQYMQLEEGQIRLLALRQGSNQDEPIECELSSCKLDNAPSYEALSYFWGTNQNIRVISVHGSTFRVRKIFTMRYVVSDNVKQVGLYGSILSVSIRVIKSKYITRCHDWETYTPKPRVSRLSR